MSTTEYAQVGSTCLRDFCGIDPTWAANAFALMGSLDSLTDEDSFGGMGGVRYHELEATVAAACCALRHFGWVKSGAFEGVATKFVMVDILAQKKDFPEIEGQDFDQAAKVIEFVRNDQRDSDFHHNLRVVFAHEAVKFDHYGLIAAAAGMHSVNVAQAAERAVKAAEDAEKSNEHVGSIGERIELVLTVISVSERPSDFGVTYLTKLEDEAGNAFTWWGSRPLDENTTYKGKWTVKKHGEFRDRKDTTINRPAKNLAEV